MWTCFLFGIFKKCNIPMVAMGTVKSLNSSFSFMLLSNLCCCSECCTWHSAVSNWVELGYWEEKQADWDLSLLPCTSYWELLYMHGWCWISATVQESEESWCGNFQHINSYHNALLCAGEGRFQVQVFKCARLGIWCATSSLWNTTLQK